MLRTEVRGDFNIHGTRYFQDAVFHQESKICNVVSLLYLWLPKKPVLYMKYWQGWFLLENNFSVITSRVNISCRARVFWPAKGTGGLQHHKFSIFDGKQHPENIWFRGCLNHPWLLFLNICSRTEYFYTFISNLRTTFLKRMNKITPLPILQSGFLDV